MVVSTETTRREEGAEEVDRQQVLQLRDSGSLCPELPQAQEEGRYGGHGRRQGGASSLVKLIVRAADSPRLNSVLGGVTWAPQLLAARHHYFRDRHFPPLPSAYGWLSRLSGAPTALTVYSF